MAFKSKHFLLRITSIPDAPTYLHILKRVNPIEVKDAGTLISPAEESRSRQKRTRQPCLSATLNHALEPGSKAGSLRSTMCCGTELESQGLAE